MKGPLGWQGGKWRFARKIVANFPPHSTYVEPFGGSLAVLFEKQPARSEVVNDAHRELVNFFWVVQRSPKRLIRRLDLGLASEYLHEYFLEQDPAEMGNVERALRFAYLNRQAFGMRVGDGVKDVGGTWAISSEGSPKFDSVKLIQGVRSAHSRLRTVHITCRDYRELKTESLDRKDTLWYLDPPYFGTDQRGYSGQEVKLREFVRWARSLSGKVIISHQASKRVLAKFKDWNVVTIGKRTNFISRKRRTQVTELLIMNFKPITGRRRELFEDISGD